MTTWAFIMLVTLVMVVTANVVAHYKDEQCEARLKNQEERLRDETRRRVMELANECDIWRTASENNFENWKKVEQQYVNTLCRLAKYRSLETSVRDVIDSLENALDHLDEEEDGEEDEDPSEQG